jgi:hypothetical protein
LITIDLANRLNVFANMLQAMLAKHYDPPPAVRVSPGGRVRLRVYLDWEDTGGAQQVYCFVDAGDGRIIKAKGWSTPTFAWDRASTIFDGDFGLSTCADHGINYRDDPVVRYPPERLRKP